jgi:Skp family chaperone for outer membrane proteins
VGLTSAQRQSKEAELRRQQQQLDQHTNDLRARADQRQTELMKPLEDRVKAVIEGLRAERNIGVVFDVAAPGGGIVAVDQTLDLTSVVIQRLKAPPQ